MANLIARNSTGFTTATTWGVAEAGASATQTTRSSSTNTTTSYVYSSAFTVTNLNVIEGLLLRCKRLNSTGTVTVALSDDNGVTATRSVTVNASDLPLTDDSWVFFKFGSTLTGDGGADYKVGVTASSAANATFYRDGTAGNWTRLLRTSTTQVPVAADAFYIAGEWTAAATVTALTVTLNETATTDYGTMDIGHQGTATAGTTAATNYYLRLSGDLNVWAGGTLSLGTVGTPVPTGSTFKLNFDCGSNVQYGLIVNNQGTLVAQGATKTVRALLAANASAAATALTTDVSTGWLNGDEIAIASTTRTYSESEKKTMGANASGTSIGTIAALTNAHSGTAPARADLGNLTRNVQIFGASASLQTYLQIAATATADIDYAELYWMGSGTALKRGIDVSTTTGSFDIRYSSLHDFVVASSLGLYVSALTSGTFYAANNVLYNINTNHLLVDATSSATWTFTGNLCILSPGSWIISLNDIGGIISGNTVAGSSSVGFYFNQVSALGTFSGNTAYSNASVGFYFTQNPSGDVTLSSSTAWRNNNYGFYNLSELIAGQAWTFDGVTAFGNLNYNVKLFGGKYIFNTVVSSGDSTFATAYGLGFDGGGAFPSVVINNSTFGVATGIKVSHSSGDITTASTAFLSGSNNTFASTNPFVLNASNTAFTAGFNKWGQVSGANRTYAKAASGTTTFNITTSDSVIYNTASPSERMTPATTSHKMLSGSKAKTVVSGATATFSVYVRKSSSGDAGGANYNGAAPRLRVRTNAALGIGDGATDVTLDTVSVGLGSWELLTGTTSAVSEDGVLIAYVDCDGTAGWINVDDWA